MGVDQAHEAIDGSTVMDRDSGASEAEKLEESNWRREMRKRTREERRGRTRQEREEVKLVSRIEYECDQMVRKRGREEPGATWEVV